MKRPLLVVTIGYVIGIVWGLYCSCSIAFLYVIFILFYILSKNSFNPQKKLKLFSIKRYLRYIKIFLKFNVIAVLIITSMISNIIIQKQNNRYNYLYKEIENVNLTGIIISNAKKKENTNIYKIKVEKINNNLKFKNTYLLLQLKNNLTVEYGDKVKIKGKFEEPSIQRNYEGFNYKEFLKTQKIFGTVKVAQINVINKNCNNIILMTSNNLFLKIKNNIENAMPENISIIVLGIMLGDTANMEEDIKQNFRDSGMAHILAVSGLHVTYIVLGITTILNSIFRKKKIKNNNNFFIINIYVYYRTYTFSS